MPNTEVRATPPAPIDISMERYRIYTYADGKKFRIAEPSELYLIDGGDTHRVVSIDGTVHRPERGWLGISWMPRDPKTPFVA